MRRKILIYCDYGTNDIANLKRSLTTYFQPLNISIETTDAKSIIKENALNDNVLAFFMPGGRATPYLEKLKHQGNQKIREYVKNGGIYFGICAGAYYASRQVFFETDVPELAITQKCGLNLLSADAIGTLHKELDISPYTRDFDSMTKVNVRWLKDNERHSACYHGGPYFHLYTQKNIEVLAQYELPEQELPAVIMQKQGKGLAIASGLHIEDSGKDLRRILFSWRKDISRATKLIDELEKAETSRLALFNKLMQKIITR